MVSLNKIGGKTNSKDSLVICGLSTDEKPIEKFEGYTIGNGSIFVEIDEGNEYLYDVENKKWNLRKVSSGGSFEGIESITSEELNQMWGD